MVSKTRASWEVGGVKYGGRGEEKIGEELELTKLGQRDPFSPRWAEFREPAPAATAEGVAEETPQVVAGEVPREMMREAALPVSTKPPEDFTQPVGGFRGMRFRAGAGSVTERKQYEKEREEARRVREKEEAKEFRTGLVATAEKKEREKKEKEARALRAGFSTLYKASPELQKLLPDLDLEEMGATEIHGMMAAMQIGEKAKGLRPEKEVKPEVTVDPVTGARIVTGPPGGFAVLPEKKPTITDRPEIGQVIEEAGVKSVFRGKFDAEGRPLYDPVRGPRAPSVPQLSAEKRVFFNRRRQIIMDEITEHREKLAKGDKKVGFFGATRQDEITRLEKELSSLEQDIQVATGGLPAAPAAPVAAAPAAPVTPAPGGPPMPTPAAGAVAGAAAPGAAGQVLTMEFTDPNTGQKIKKQIPVTDRGRMEKLGGRVI